MGQLIDLPGQNKAMFVTETPAGFMPGEVLTEYVRQSYHLFRGKQGERGAQRFGETSLALWCVRRTGGFKTMQCALFPAKSDDPPLVALKEILELRSPDAATIRVMRRFRETNDRPPRMWLAGGYLILSMGQDTSFEFLPFNGDFDSFLGALGKKTRSHTRSSLRTFERDGYGYRLDVPARLQITPEIREIAARNMPYAPESKRLDLQTDYANGQKMPFQSTLSAPDGKSISIIRGYLIDGHAALVDQMNPETYPKIGQTGPSLLHRALLIRALIGRNLQGLIVTGGCGGMLTRYCRPMTFDSYLALSLNPSSWLRCLPYVVRDPAMGRWALGRFFGRLGSGGRTPG
jgi:hypothetical protein